MSSHSSVIKNFIGKFSRFSEYKRCFVRRPTVLIRIRFVCLKYEHRLPNYTSISGSLIFFLPCTFLALNVMNVLTVTFFQQFFPHSQNADNGEINRKTRASGNFSKKKFLKCWEFFSREMFLQWKATNIVQDDSPLILFF